MPSDPKQFAVYIISNCKRGTLYVGVTSNLPNRTTQHREGAIEGFIKKYQLKRLVCRAAFRDDNALRFACKPARAFQP